MHNKCKKFSRKGFTPSHYLVTEDLSGKKSAVYSATAVEKKKECGKCHSQQDRQMDSQSIHLKRKEIIILTTVNIEDREKSRVSTKVEEERYPETFRHLCHHQSSSLIKPN